MEITKWEKIDCESNINWSVTERLKVPGGWIVRSTVHFFEKKSGAMTSTFVSDPDHIWKGIKS
jgi:hypothetical protein